MARIILNICQYGIIFIMLIYTYLSFSVHRTKRMDRLKRKYIAQNILCFIIFILCYGILFYFNRDTKVLLMGLVQGTYLLAYILLFRGLYPGCSRLLVNNSALLLAIGFVMIERLAPDKSLKQFIIILIGTVIALLIPVLMKYRDALIRFRYVYAGVGAVLLLATLILGRTSYGANLSIRFGVFSFQPSEFVKILYVLFMASFMVHANRFRHVVVSAIVTGTYILVLAASNDLGAALIFFVVYVVLLYVSTGRIQYMLIGLVAGCVAAVLAYFLFSHVRVRVTAWIDPWSVIDSKGYQITQSLFAIGTGGFFGLGLCRGMPTKIPVVEKDFVLSAISEEFGLIFAICIILICFSCFMGMMRAATKIRDRFYKLLAVGCAMTYSFQCFLTIGGVTKFIPSTGVTLPFVSYGGSSALVSMILFSIVQSCCIIADKIEREAENSELQQSGEEGVVNVEE